MHAHPRSPRRDPPGAVVTPELAQQLADAIRSALGDRPPEPLAVDPTTAAAMLSMSRTAFDDHVLPDLRYRRAGARIVIPVAELHRWLEDADGTQRRAELARRLDRLEPRRRAR